MTHTYKVANLNINGISSPTRLQMLEDFLYNHDIDIALLKEVTHPTIQKINRYAAHFNQGTGGRGNGHPGERGARDREHEAPPLW